MLTRGFVVLWFAMFVAMAGMSMVSPLLPVYVKEQLGGPAVAVALSFSGVAIAQLIASPFTGRLGDRFGPKRFIVAGFAVYALGALGYLFATTWEHVILFRVLSGVGAAGVFPMTLAYIGRLAPPGHEGRFMGSFSVAQIAGFGVGPLVGGGIRDAAGSPAAFAVMAVLLGSMALAVLLLLPGDPATRRPAVPGEPPARAPQPALPWSRLVRLAEVQGAVLFVSLMSLGMGAASSFMAIFVVSAEGLNTNSALFVGVLLSGRSLVGAVLQPLTGVLADRMSRVALVAVGLAISGVGQVLVPLVPRDLVETSLLGAALTMAPWVLAVVLLAGIAEAIAFPAQQAVFVTIGRRVGMGSLMGLNSMGNSIGFLSGSLLGAGVVSRFGIDAVFPVAGMLLLVGAGLFVLVMRRAPVAEEPIEAAPRLVETAEAPAGG